MKKQLFYFIWFIAIAIVVVVLWKFFPLGSKQTAIIPSSMEITGTESKLDEPIQPIPLEIRLDERKIALGGRLFHDARLSHDNTVNCAKCHSLSQGGVDNLPHSIGVNGAAGDVNSPTVYNSGFNFKQFWNGRAETLEDQVDGPTSNPKEMASNWPEIIGKLKEDKDYVLSFDQIYPDGITSKNTKDAIATFERRLITPNSRFDRYLRGDMDAIKQDEKEGYQLFKDLGCVVCHQGVNVGSNMFQTLGKFGNYFEDRGNIQKADWGRFNVTNNEKDRYKFKVPSLRNIELTAPYFHDSSQTTLKDAVQTMAKYQLGRLLSDEETDLIVKFLKTLTGEYEGNSLGGPSS